MSSLSTSQRTKHRAALLTFSVLQSSPMESIIVFSSSEVPDHLTYLSLDCLNYPGRAEESQRRSEHKLQIIPTRRSLHRGSMLSTVRKFTRNIKPIRIHISDYLNTNTKDTGNNQIKKRVVHKSRR